MDRSLEEIEASGASLRGIARGGRARGRGRIIVGRNQPGLVERQEDEVSVTETIAQFNRDEELEEVLSTTTNSLSVEDSTSEGVGHAYVPSVVDSHAAARSSSVGPSSAGTGSEASLRRKVETPVITLPRGFVKTGTKGKQIDLTTNYYRMNEKGNFKLFQYQVDFVPMEDDTAMKKKLVRQHEEALGAYIFDGSMMRKTNIIPKKLTTLFSTASERKYTITIRMVGEISPEDNNYLQFFNIVMRKVNEMLGMEEMGRNFYDPLAAIEFPEHQLSLWPGFQTAIRNHESGTLLCVEVTHKVLRTASVYETILSIGKNPRLSRIEFVSTFLNQKFKF